MWNINGMNRHSQNYRERTKTHHWNYWIDWMTISWVVTALFLFIFCSNHTKKNPNSCFDIFHSCSVENGMFISLLVSLAVRCVDSGELCESRGLRTNSWFTIRLTYLLWQYIKHMSLCYHCDCLHCRLFSAALDLFHFHYSSDSYKLWPVLVYELNRKVNFQMIAKGKDISRTNECWCETFHLFAHEKC